MQQPRHSSFCIVHSAFCIALALAVASARAELPSAASVISRIQSRLAVPAHTNGPTFAKAFGAYLALPLDAPPAREAEGWLALVERSLAVADPFDNSGEESVDVDMDDHTLAPFLVRLPSAEAWPAVREGLAVRADACDPTNTPPLLIALQYVFDRLAHDESAASNRLARLRAATTASDSKNAEFAFRQLERQLNRKGRMPQAVESYFNSLSRRSRYVSIPSVFLRLPSDRLWQLTAPVLTNAEVSLSFTRDDDKATPPALLSLACAHAGELAAASGFSLVDHTPAGRELYETLLSRFDFASLPIPPGADDEDDGDDDDDEDVKDDEDDEDDEDDLSADDFAKLLARAQQKQPAAPRPKGYGDFTEATSRVLRGVLSRDGFPAACDFASRFPTNFFRTMEFSFSDGGAAEMDFLERFVLGSFYRTETWDAYARTAMQCGETARARAKLREVQSKASERTDLLQTRLRLAAFDDDAEAITALAREGRSALQERLGKEFSHSCLELLEDLANLLAATSNRTELAALSDFLSANEKTILKTNWGYSYYYARDRYWAALVSALEKVGLADKAFETAFGLLAGASEPGETFYGCILPLYGKAGRHQDIVNIVEGDSHFFATNALQLIKESSAIAELYAEALAKVGRGAEAAAIAREMALRWHLNQSCGDWPFRILADELEPGPFIDFMDALYAADRFEERPLIWKAEVLRRAGRLDEAEAVARKAVEVDPTDGETRAGDRIRSYVVLADILDARGSAKEAAFLRGAVKAVRLAEEGDVLQECGLVRRSLAKYAEAEKFFSAAYCVQWRKAERLRELGLVEEANRHYEETFRQLPSQFGFVASLCFGCAGIFDSPGAVPIAERILTEAAAGETPAPAACFLLGMLREEQKRYGEAFEAYARATALAPDYLDAYVAQDKLRFRVRRPRADWERIQARIFALDPLGRHSEYSRYDSDSEILDWGLAKRLESEALRKLPAPDFDSLRKIVFPASAARMAEKNGKDRSSSRLFKEEEQFRLEASTRRLQSAAFINALADLVDVLMGWRDHGETMYCCASGDYDDFFF